METKTLQPDLKAIEKELKKDNVRFARLMFHMPTPQHKFGKRGIGYTRKSHAKSPAKRHNAKMSRRINREISEKKFRPSGSKKRI